MRTLKSHPLLRLVNSYLIDSAQPSNISYWWNFGVRRARLFIKEKCPILIVYSLETMSGHLYKLRLATLLKSNKLLHWIAGKERLRKSGLPSVIAKASRCEHVEDNKLDTYKRDQFSGTILSRIRRWFWSIVYIYIRRGVHWREASRYPSLRDSKYAQAAKLTRTLSGMKTQPRDLTAFMRGRSLHTRTHLGKTKKDLKGDSPVTSDKYMINSGQEKAERDDKRKPKVDSSKQTAASIIMETLTEWDKKGQKIRDLMKILSDPYYLVKCYEEIKSKPGNMTKGTKPETLDKIDFEWFTKVANQLLMNSFDFSSSRRVEIPKPNSTKTRPLTIASPRDKIVQKGVQLILQAIWEKKFKDSSHGFRANRSVHTALKALYLKGQTYSWVVQGDISKCFDKIPHSLVLKYLKEEIADTAFLNLIMKYLKGGHIDPKTGKLVRTDIGIPQGGVLTPILCNIVLDKFDAFMESVIEKFEIGKKRRHNPEYQRLQHLRKKAKTQHERLKYLQQMRHVNAGDPKDPNYKRMMYIRYADDFVILIIGSMDEATLMKARCKDALKRLCGAESVEKTLVTHVKEGFNFLGAEIRKLDKNTEYTGQMGIGGLERVFTRRLLINAPITKLIDNLVKAKMIRRNAKGECVPISCTSLTNLSHYEIISFYNFKINGILNFYSFASNYSHLGTIIWYLRHSCALTLARKNKLGTARQSFIKYGSHLTDPETGKEVIIPKTLKTTHSFQVKKEIPNPGDICEHNMGAHKLTETAFGNKCAICGSGTKLEMHHLRSVKDVRAKMRTGDSSYEKWIGATKRKQIPLCSYHHRLYHKGELGYEDLTLIKRWA